MNIRLNTLKLLASLVLLLGVGFVLMGVAVGFKIGESGGLALLAGVAVGAPIITLGCVFIARVIRFLRKPTVGDATDVLTVFSLIYIFGPINSALNSVFPGGTGFTVFPAELDGSRQDNTDPILLLVAALLAWASFRVLKKCMLVGAFPPASEAPPLPAAHH